MNHSSVAFNALRLGGASVVLWVLAGCASTSQNSGATVASSTPEDIVICGQEASTGTRIATTRCRRVADIEARRKSDREAAEALPTELPMPNGR